MKAPQPAPNVATVAHPTIPAGAGVTIKATGLGAYFAGCIADDPETVLVREDASGEWRTLPADEVERA